MISFHLDDRIYMRSPELTSLSLFHCQYYRTSVAWEGRTDFSAHALLLYVSQGEMRIKCEETEYTVGEGCFFLLDANRRYRMSCDRRLSMYRVGFSCTDGAFLEGLTPPAVLQGSLLLSQRVAHLYHGIQDKRPVELCEVTLLEILLELSLTRTDASGSEKLYQSFCRYCDTHLSESLDAETVSATLGCHKDHLNRVIKRFGGKTFRDYVAAIKLEAAQTLLVQTDLSIAQIALEVGFSTTELFTKFFRYHTQTTPKRYRMIGRSGDGFFDELRE